LLNARGDYLLNLPALRALARSVSHRLVLIVRKEAQATFLRDVPARRVIEVDAVYEDGSYHFDPALVAARIVSLGDVERFVSLNPWISTSLDQLVKALRPTWSVGLGEGPWAVSVGLDFDCHSSELAFRAIREVEPGLELDEFVYPPAYPSEALRFARELRDEVTAGGLLVVHRDTKQEKQWIDEGWIEVLGRWVRENPSGLVVDVGLAALPTESDSLSERVLHGLRLPLAHALALTSVADAFIGVDSCFLHAADLAGVPAVGLFFSTDPHEFGLRWTPHHHLCVREAAALEADTVLAALASLSRESSKTTGGLVGRARPAATEAFFRRRGDRALARRERQGLALSTVGLGTGRFTFDCDLAAADVLARALALGCNVVDVAGNHGGGEGPAVVGAALRRAIAKGLFERDQLFLSGKAGFTEHLVDSPFAKAQGWEEGEHCMARDFLAWEFDRQCRWLGVSQLDAFLLQNPEEHLLTHGAGVFWEALTEAFRLFELLIVKGRLGAYGVSTAEAFRVSRDQPGHIDLADLAEVARSVGGENHGFRVLELPVSVACLEALDVAAHRTADGDELPALVWADQAHMTVLASASLNGGGAIDALSSATTGLVQIGDPAGRLLQVARSVPGVTCALVGISTPTHLACFEALIGQDPIDLSVPVTR
jgi:ADP-heptose:LPS heptosyltransferase